jgi:hypothetical protein
VNRQPISSTESLVLPITPESTTDSRERERVTILIATAVLYAVLCWVVWPSLGFQTIGLGEEASISALRHMSFGDALTHVGASWWRPGEGVMLWLVAHSPSLLPWRVAMLALLLLTTAYLQYDGTVRGRSHLDGFGAAVAFSLNPTTLSVVCWFSAANISLCAVGLLAYVAFARRALETKGSPVTDALGATLALCFALSFYELALFAPLFVLCYQLLLAPRPQRSAKLYLYGGSALSVLGYLGLQAVLADLPRFWQGSTPLALVASSARYVVQNFYLWFNPFETFGVLIPDQPGGHALENLFGFAVVGAGFVLAWYFRKRDPLTALSGLWFVIFLAPVGTFLHFEGSPVAEQHLYVPMLGVALGATRLFTRSLEGLVLRIRNKPARVAFELTFSLFLLWSLAPLVAECKRTVEHWGDTRELYLTTLQNYPNSTGALDHLTEVLSAQPSQLTAAPEQRKPEWKQFVDAFLLCPNPRPASQLLTEGRSLMKEERYADASSALARAFATSASAREQLDAGKGLVQALSHTSLSGRAPALVERLRRDHPDQLRELDGL